MAKNKDTRYIIQLLIKMNGGGLIVGGDENRAWKLLSEQNTKISFLKKL